MLSAGGPSSPNYPTRRPRRGSRSPPAAARPGSSCRVVRRLARDRNVVDVAFGQAGVGDPDELRALLKLGDRGRSGIAHRGLHAADELVDDLAYGALVGNLALDAFRHQFQM